MGQFAQLRPPAFVAPTISGKEHNTIKTNVIPFAGWPAEDVRFAFGSSFIRPDINTEIGALKDLIDDHTLPDQKGDPKHKPPLTVFGHADPTGNEDYDKIPSGRRAQAMYGMLVRDVDWWEDLFSNPTAATNGESRPCDHEGSSWADGHWTHRTCFPQTALRGIHG